MPTLTRDAFGPDLEAAAAAAYATLPHPIPPQDTPMPRFEIRFTYSVNRNGNQSNESDKHTLEAESSTAAHRAFTDWFNDAYAGATLRSTSILQVPGG